MNTTATTTTDAPMTAQDSPDLDAMTLEELQAEESRAENAVRKAKDALLDARVTRQELLYDVKNIKIQKLRTGGNRYTFEASAALRELIEEGQEGETFDEMLFFFVHAAIADVEDRHRNSPFIQQGKKVMTR